MAQAIKLNYGGKVVYPVSLSDLIIEPESKKTVTELLKGLKTAIADVQADVDGVSLTKVNSLQYKLVDKDGTQIGDMIDIPQDTFLDAASLVEVYPDPENAEAVKTGKALKFVFNTGSGKEDIYVPVDALIHEYIADGTTIELDASTNKFSVKEGVFASAEQGEAAASALQGVSGSTYITVGEKTDDNKQTISATVQAVADASESNKGLAEASDVKSYVDAQDKAITDTIGGAFTSASTVHDAIEALRKNQQDSGNANALVGTSADTIQTITVWGAHNYAADAAQAAAAAQADATQALSDAADAAAAAAAASDKVDTEIAKLNANVSGGTDVVVTVVEENGVITSVSSDATALKNAIDAVSKTIGGSYTSAATVNDAIAALGERIDNLGVEGSIADVINALSASKSGESHGVSVTVNTASGNVSSVNVVAPDFDALYDAKGDAAAAETAAITSAITYTNEAISGFVSYTLVADALTYDDDLDQYVPKTSATA